MVDSYLGTTTEAQQDAVAEVMRYCGQSFQTDYTPYGSGAVCFDLDLLVNCLGYDPGVYTARAACYTVSGWDALIYNELHEGRPIVYVGFATDGGHAFVLDGYEVQGGEGYYSVNWGWSGQCNGFYKLNLLNPDASGLGGSTTKDGYNCDQEALIGFQPRQNPSEAFYRRLSPWNWDITDGTDWHEFWMLNESYRSGIFSFGITERRDDGTPDLTRFVFTDDVDIAGFTTSAIVNGNTDCFLGFVINDENAPQLFEGLTPGRHDLVLVCRENVVGAPWTPVFGPNGYIEVNIGATGELTAMTVHPAPILSIPDGSFKTEGLHQCGLAESVTATVNNAGSDDFIGGVECAAFSVEDGVLKELSCISAAGIQIEGGSTTDIAFDISVPEAGDHVVLLTLEGYGQDYSGMALADLSQVPGYIGHTCITFDELQFYCLDAQYAERSDEMEYPAHFINITLQNGTTADYDAALIIDIYKSDGAGGYTPVVFPGYSYPSTHISIPSGQSQVGSIYLPEALEAGDYRIDMLISKYFAPTYLENYFPFDSVSFTVNPTGVVEVKS